MTIVPPLLRLMFSVTREKSYLKTIWDYDNANYIAINQHLQNTDWDMKFGDSDNVNIINEVINLELNSAMNTCIPKKIIRVRPRDKPWINSEIKCKIRKRNRVHKKAKFRNLASDWEIFRRIRNEIIDMIREAKKQYIIKLQNSLIDKSIPPGKWWRIFKECLKI